MLDRTVLLSLTSFSTTHLLPLRVVRRITDIGLPHQILSSSRYASADIFKEISVSPSNSDIGFRGRWIATGSLLANPSHSSDPASSDIVVLYLHGGGYASSSTATYLLFLLVLVEFLNKANIRVSVFALEYDLAPEYQYPWQQRQAVARYHWLREQVEPSKLLVMGDSAGGHLALSTLVELNAGQNSGMDDVRPGGIMLLSPWLTMRPPQPTNEMTDVLSVEFLARTATRFAGKKRDAGVEFLTSKINWDEVLPKWVWVSAGRNEVMYEDIVRWIVERGVDCTGESRICGEVDRNEAHVYAWLKTTDFVERKAFLGQQMGEGLAHYDAIQRIAEAIEGRVRKMKVSNGSEKIEM